MFVASFIGLGLILSEITRRNEMTVLDTLTIKRKYDDLPKLVFDNSSFRRRHPCIDTVTSDKQKIFAYLIFNILRTIVSFSFHCLI